MKIKGIGFDIGGTLVNYNKPLNWSASYRDAIEFMCKQNELVFTEERFIHAKKVLEKYNTRMNPREKEVTSETIFKEIFESWGEDITKLYQSKKSFYQFFQREAILYDDAINLLAFCKDNAIKCAVYTDVAYGMDDEFALNDISPIAEYIDLKLTSGNVGYRKPNTRGFEIMMKEWKSNPEETIYIGDEQKDIQGPKAIKMKTILINRESTTKDYGQDYTVSSLEEVIDIVKKI